MASIQTKKSSSVLGSLLDRLTERLPDEVSEATLERGEMPLADLEESIYRDLCWLVQSTSLETTTELSRWPNVRRSVLNYGIPVFAGKVLGNAELGQIEASLKRSIELFEPRLQSDSLTVNAVSSLGEFDHRTIRIQIVGECVDHHGTCSVAIQVCIDLDTGRLQVLGFE
ncbi:MAG: type VI secretion system baseplate subunit TssE [Pirellula sp.]